MEEKGVPRERESGLQVEAPDRMAPAPRVPSARRVLDGAPTSVFVTVRARLTDHFLRRLEERGGDLGRLLVEGDVIAVEGWLRAVHDRDFNLVVPGFGQIRIRVDRSGNDGFVAVTFLPLGAT